jgi:hypothetical protein
MSHLSEILDQQSWLTTAATDISLLLPAEVEQNGKQIEREIIEQQKGLRVCRCGMRYDNLNPDCSVCPQQPSTQ